MTKARAVSFHRIVLYGLLSLTLFFCPKRAQAFSLESYHAIGAPICFSISIIAALLLALLYARHLKLQHKLAAERLFSDHLRSEICRGYSGMLLRAGEGRDRPICSFCVNLTDNCCFRIYSEGGDFMAMADTMTADQFFEELLAGLDKSCDTGGMRAKLNREALLELFEKDGGTLAYEHRYFREPGSSPIWLALNIVMTKAPGSDTVEALVFMQNINEEKTAHTLLEHTARVEYECLFIVNAVSGLVELVNGGEDNAPLKAGRAYDEVIEATAELSVSPDDRDSFRRGLSLETIERELRNSDCYTYSCFYGREGGRALRKRWVFSYMDESRSSVTVTRRDVTEQFAADLDPLSGLYRREKFNSEARRVMDLYPNMRFVILRFDLDRFKAYNDLFGEDAGDRLLGDIGALLLKSRPLLEPCVAGRIEADHYMLCMPFDKIRTLDGLMNEARRLEEAHPEFSFTLRSGIYIVDDASLSVSIMGDRALMALRSIKGKDSQHQAFYNRSMRNKLLEEQELISDLREAFENDQFIPYIQPQVNMVTGDIMGAEALARWQHPRKGLIAPGVFIPVLERRGHIMKLDRVIWEKTCALLARWMEEGRKVVPISVNISRADAADPALISILLELLEKYSLEPKYLRLEITESAYLDNPEQIIETVKKLRTHGFFVEMDDFGSGNSSLNTLKEVPTDMLKLDMRFLSQAGDRSKSGIILNSVINMAHWLNIPVLAEGVELPYQADYLKTIGCSLAQGYLYAKPMPASEFEKMLEDRNVTEFHAASQFAVFFNNEEFWDPQSQATLIFNSFVGAAGIFEYSRGAIKPTRLNDKIFELLSIEREGAKANDVFRLEDVVEEDQPLYVSLIERADKEDCETAGEIRVLTGKHLDAGDPLWLRLRMRCIARRFDSCIIYASIEDVTDRKKMERTLRVGREELKMALENIGKMICYYDIPTRTLLLPQSYSEKHADPREIKGIPYASKNVVTEDRQMYYAFYETLIEGETPEPIVVRVRNACGGYAWERLSATLLRDEKGLPLRAVITIDDMTQEMNHEAETELNRMLMSWADTCVCDYDVAQDTLHLQTSRRGNGIETSVIKGYYDYLLETDGVQTDWKEGLRAVIASASETPSRGSHDYVADLWGTGFRWCRLHYVSLADQAGRVYRMVGQVVDVEDEKKREILMRRLGEVDEGAVMPKLDVPIAERVFQLLYKSTDLEKSVAEALKITGSYYRASRAALFLDVPGHKSCANTCEWVADGVPSRMSERQNVPVAFDDGSDVYEKLYDKNGVLVCSDSGLYTEAQRRVLMMDDVASAVRSKLMDGSTCCGFVSFESCGQKRLWTEEETETITLVARLIGVFLTAKLRMDDAFFSQEATSVLENCSSYIYIIDPADYKVLFANKKIRDACPETGLEGVPCYSLFMGEEAPCVKCPVALYKKTGKSTGVETTRPNGTCLLACASSFLWRGREIMMIECTDITRQKRAEAALRQQNEENSIVIRHSGAERLRYNLTERIAYHSARGAAQFGVPQVMSNFPQSFIDAGKVAEESVGAFLAYFESMRNGVPNGSANVLVRVASGESRWYHSDYTLMASGNGAPASAIVSFYDNTEMMEREVAYRKWQALLASKLEQSAVYLEVNLSQNYVERNENTRLPFEKDQSFSACMHRCAEATAPEDREMYTEFFDEGRLLGLFFAGVKEDNLVFREETDGLFRWTKANVQMVKYPYTDDVKAFIVFEDIHEERSAIVELAERASHDAMTNLLNREATLRMADERIEAMGSADRCAAFMIDLDNFKQINDSLGHLQGDEALIAASKTMRAVLRDDDIIGRIGGDEFFIFISGNVTPRSAAKTAERLIAALEVSCGFLRLTASAGVAVARKTDNVTSRELYAAADRALYEAKRAGKNKYYLTEWAVQ